MKAILKTLALALALVTVTVAAPALARDHDRDHGRHGHDRDRDGRDRHYHGNGHWDNGRRGPPPWARGHDYRSYGYRDVHVVPAGEYVRYRLYAPRPGYRWVRDDSGSFLLVAAATGIIADLILHH